MVGSAHSRRATDTVGAGVRSRLGEDAVAARGDAWYQTGAEVQSGAAGSDQSPHEVVVAVAGSRQLGETAAPVVNSELVMGGGLGRWAL